MGFKVLHGADEGISSRIKSIIVFTSAAVLAAALAGCPKKSKPSDESEQEPGGLSPKEETAPQPPGKAAGDEGEVNMEAYKKDLYNICNAAELSGASKTEDFAERSVKTADWLSKNLHSGEAIQFMQAVSVMEPEARPGIIMLEAKKHGLASCPMADELAKGPPE